MNARDTGRRCLGQRGQRCIAVPLMLALAVCALFARSALAQVETNEALHRLTKGGHVLLLRHALAPGTGDPPEFRLGECTTQRNLDERGRAQARAIGAWLRWGRESQGDRPV